MSDWHPMLAAVEREVGHWVMVDPTGREYGDIRIVRRGTEVGYRAEFRGQLVGYYLTLRSSCARVHQAFIASHGPQDNFYGLDAHGESVTR